MEKGATERRAMIGRSEKGARERGNKRERWNNASSREERVENEER